MLTFVLRFVLSDVQREVIARTITSYRRKYFLCLSASIVCLCDIYHSLNLVVLYAIAVTDNSDHVW